MSETFDIEILRHALIKAVERYDAGIYEGSLEAYAPELLEAFTRFEQAEQDRVKLRNRLDAMRRQRNGYRNQLRKSEQQVQRVRELREGQLCGHCADEVQDALDGDGRG